jgi:uncharacterized membrane protein
MVVLKRILGVIVVVLALFFGGVIGVSAASSDSTVTTKAMKDPGTGGM